MVKIKKIEYPPNIKDKKAYREMQKYADHPYFTDEEVRFVQTSDSNIKIDLQANTSVIEKKISHLPEDTI